MREYSTDLYNYAFVRLNNKGDAEDAVQTSFLKAYKSHASFKPGSDAKSWLFAILLNTIRDEIRRKSRQPVIHDVDEDFHLEELVKDLSKNPEEELLHKEGLERLSLGLAAMPDHFSTPLILREVRNLSYQEIANALSIPIGTVMSRLSRARKLLTEYMNYEETCMAEKSSESGGAKE